MIGEIENAILERLKKAGTPSEGPLGYSWGTLDSYPEDWETYAAQNLIKMPAALVTFGGWTDEVQTGSEVSVRAKFGLMLVARSLRNQKAARQGVNASEVGSFQLAQDAAALLIGQELGLDIAGLEIGSLQFVTLTPAMVKNSWSVLALELRTAWDIETASYHPDAEFDGEFTTFAGAWDVPPFFTPDNNLQADLFTTQTLPTEET